MTNKDNKLPGINPQYNAKRSHRCGLFFHTCDVYSVISCPDGESVSPGQRWTERRAINNVLMSLVDFLGSLLAPRTEKRRYHVIGENGFRFDVVAVPAGVDFLS